MVQRSRHVTLIGRRLVNIPALPSRACIAEFRGAFGFNKARVQISVVIKILFLPKWMEYLALLVALHSTALSRSSNIFVVDDIHLLLARELLQQFQIHILQCRLMRTFQLDRRRLRLLTINRLPPLRRLHTPPLPRPYTHLFQIDLARFRREVEEGLGEFGGDRCGSVAESGFVRGRRDGFRGHGVHGAGGMLEEGFVEDWGELAWNSR